jgi:hypothetical protein
MRRPTRAGSRPDRSQIQRAAHYTVGRRGFLLALTPAQRTLRPRRPAEKVVVAEAAQGRDIREVVAAIKLARILDGRSGDASAHPAQSGR